MLKNRICKLEQAAKAMAEIRISEFIIDPGRVADGYQVGDVVVWRRNDESGQQVMARCSEAADWAQGSAQTFYPVYGDEVAL